MDFRRFEKPHVISDLCFGSKFLESLYGSAIAHWDHEPRRVPLTRPSGTLSPSEGEGWGEGVRFMESVGLRAGLVLAREVMMNLVRDEETNLQL